MKKRRPDFTLTNPGSLIAAIPAVLGFAPEKSLVLVGLERGLLGAVMRVDLCAVQELGVGGICDAAQNSGAQAVVAVIVDSDVSDCLDAHGQLDADLGEELAQRHMKLIATHIVDRVAEGGVWRCADGCGARGVIDDPGSSNLAAAAVADGRRIYANRAELQTIVAAEVAPLRQTYIASSIAVLTETGVADRLRDPHGASRTAVEQIIGAVRRIGDGAVLTDGEVAELAYGLTDLTVRDAMFAFAIGDLADAAELLWATLSRALPRPWRAETLMLWAYCAYCRGDGPLAGVALQEALQADPAHRMAGLLDCALQNGMQPSQIRELAFTGYELGDQLGAELPRRPGVRRRPGGAARRKAG